MELGGGSESATKKQTSSADAAGEDRLSALPDDVLILILRKLGTLAAAQTRVLSHRWRRVWALLPELMFIEPEPEPHRLRDALDGHNVLLRQLLVWADGAAADSLAVWLPAAARRVAGVMVVVTAFRPVEEAEDNDSEEEEAAAQRGAFEFPCFEKATKISFSLGYQGLAMPVTGVFARLTRLHLERIWFHGPGELGDAVSSTRCPCLKRLTVEDARGLRNLTIHSVSMLWMELKDLRTLSQLTIVAPALEELTVVSCFRKSPPGANISAPLLMRLEWGDEYDPTSVHLGKMAHLQWLQTGFYFVYRVGNYSVMRNQSCLSLLQGFEGIKNLYLSLLYPQDIENYDYMMEHMAVLPDITSLDMFLSANGHAFGASAFHVLRLCTGIRRFRLKLADIVSEAHTSDCKCLQLIEWETEELLLNQLEKVEINGWKGTEHEVALMKRLFDWGTELKEMRVIFDDSVTEVNAKDLYQEFQIFSRPGVCMTFYRYENHLEVLYAPKD